MNAPFLQRQVFLVFLNGPLAGQQFPISSTETHIGSDRRNEIVIPDSSILPQHAILYQDNRGFFLKRLNAQGSVAVNQKPIQDEWVTVDFSHKISLGQTGITCYLDAGNPVVRSPIGGSSSTSPHAAVPHAEPGSLYEDASTATFRRAGIPSAMSPQSQQANVASGTHEATETTRYLCMAARIDQSFRDFVFKYIVREKHRAIGESHGVDIPTVVKSCYAAQHQAFIRDLLLCGLLIASLLLFKLLSTVLSSINGYGAVLSALFSSFWVIGLLWVVLLVLLAQIKQIPVPIRVVLLLTAIFLLFFITPFYLVAWGVIIWNLWNMYYGAGTQQLRKGKFDPGKVQFQLEAQEESELRKLSDPSQNVIVYSGYSPFVGSGYVIDGYGWSFAIDSTKGKQEIGTALTPEHFETDELYTYIDEAVRKLKLRGLSISDKLYVNGKAIPDDPGNPNGAKDPDFFDNTRKRPLTGVDEKVMKQWMKEFSEDVRYYKCFRVTSWRGELVVSIFVRFIQVEKNLFAEANYMVLPPLKEEYYQLDTLEPTITLKKLWNLTKLSFFSTFSVWLLSPVRVIAYLARDWSARREQEQVKRLIESNPTFDYGASTSLREIASSSYFPLYFQKLDEIMYVKIIERQLLESIIDFLESKNIDTTDLKERQDAILNQGVMNIVSVSGGTVESLAVGEKAKAISNRSAAAVSNASGTKSKRAS